MWADFFVPAGGLSKGPVEGACRGNVFRRGGGASNICCVAEPAVLAVSAMLAMSAVPLAFCVCDVCDACKIHFETYNHIQQTINDK